MRVSFYVDDVALFVAPTPVDVRVVKQIMHAFGSASGKQDNLDKSGILLVSYENIDLPSLLIDLLILVVNFPCKYLGLPLHYNKITRGDIQPTLDKMVAKLQIWRGKLLSSDARL